MRFVRVISTPQLVHVLGFGGSGTEMTAPQVHLAFRPPNSSRTWATFPQVIHLTAIAIRLNLRCRNGLMQAGSASDRNRNLDDHP